MVNNKKDQKELYKSLWTMANDLRGNMTPNEFKDYILGIIFYRYLSEKVELTAEVLFKNDGLTYHEMWENEAIRPNIREAIINERGYTIDPDKLFSSMVKEINKKEDGNFSTKLLIEAISSLTDSTIGQESQSAFDGLFQDMDLSRTSLGRTVEERSNLMAKIIITIDGIDIDHNETEIDILGDAYEYLIGKFAANAGQKAGEFYTPQEVSEILARITTLDKEHIRSAYDPTCGSGSLLLRVKKQGDVAKLYGQESISTTYNLARMNMLLHEVHYSVFDIQNSDTIEDPRHLDKKFEVVVANPPYSQKWSSAKKYEQDERFMGYGRLAPKSYADYVFVQHMIHQLADDGVMAVVLPHGVLFRSGAEGTIRKHLIKDKNYLDAVIGLPENLFYGTNISTAILVYRKDRKKDDSILFIDASKLFEKVGNKNALRREDIDKIVATYENREEIDKFSHNASMEEIKENDYNLNIPRYVDTFEPEPRVDLKEVDLEIKDIKEKIKDIDEELEEYFKELGL